MNKFYKSSLLFTKYNNIKILSIKTYSTNKFYGEQNKFYFEESKISKQIPKSSSLYDETYRNIPVALILGWTGGIDRYLQKYKDIYSNLGYHTIRFVPSNKLTFLDCKSHPKYAYELLDLLKTEYKLTNNPIVTHFFSNASCFIIYQHILNEITKSPHSEYNFFKENHKSIIYDSAPGLQTNISDLYLGINDLVKQQIKISFISSTISYIFIAISYLFMRIFPKNYFTEMYEILIRDPRLVPSLYMYSTRDKLISFKSIKQMIERRKAMHPKLYVKEILFTDCEHVMLYQKHQLEYLKHIHEHLELCKIKFENIQKNS